MLLSKRSGRAEYGLASDGDAKSRSGGLLRKGDACMRYDFDKLIDRWGTDSIKYEMIRESGDVRMDVLPMSIADMEFATPAPVLDAMRRRLEHPVIGYSMPYDPAYGAAVSGWMKRRFGWVVDPGWIVIYPGIVSAINAAVSLLTSPGDGVITLTPAYGPFGEAIHRFRRTPVYVPMLNNGGYFTIDFEELERCASRPGNTLMLLCSPHNPTGRVFSAAELARIGEICFRHGVFVVSDEIHGDLVRNGVEQIPFMKIFPNESRVIACTSPSKTFNMAGASISNIFIPDREVRRAFSESAFTVCPNPLSIVGCVAAYDRCEPWLEQLKTYVDENFLYLDRFLFRNMPEARGRIPEGTYLAWIDLNAYGYPMEELKRRITGVGLYPSFGDSFVHNYKGFIRLNLACPRSMLADALGRLFDAMRR